MPSVSDPFVEHCHEMLCSLGAVRGRRMFSGVGFYVDEVFVAIAVREELFLKVDDATRAHFEAGGGHPFVYRTGDKDGRLGFWTVPPDAMESPSLMLPWARLAMAAALRTRAAKPARERVAKQVSQPARRVR